MVPFLVDPVHWSIDTILELGPDVIQELAKKSSGTECAYRLVLGRCLLAMDESKLARSLGYSGAVHYAVQVLGLSAKKARELKRVARALETLPLLARATEIGQMPWGKLREIVRKATFETEEFWLKIAGEKNDDEVRLLCRAAEVGGLPWDEGAELELPLTRLQLHLDLERGELFEQMALTVSEKVGRPLSMLEALEHLVVEELAQQPATPQRVENMRQEARRSANATRRRHASLIQSAYDRAEEWGLLEDADPLAVALGTHRVCSCDDQNHDCLPGAELMDGKRKMVEDGPAPDGAGDESDAGEDNRPARAVVHDGPFADAEIGPARAVAGDTPAGQGDAGGAADEAADEAAVEAAVEAADEAAYARGSQSQDRPARVDSNVRPPCADQDFELVDFGSARFAELAADGYLDERFDWQNRRLLFNPRARKATAAQRREILRRDGYCCRTPGCPHRMWLQLHHTVFFSRCGETVRANLVPLCFRCHKNVHEGLLKITGDADGRLTFTDAHGLNLQRAHAIGVADWLNFWIGWFGNEDDCHQPKLSRAG